jgi:hypothetical protein
MSVTETLMKPGAWQVRLIEETPAEILRALDWTVTAVAGFGHVFVFSAPVRPEEFTDANLKSIAIYAGILREAPEARTVGGPGMVAWLGDEDDKGAVLETAVTQTAATLQTWVNALRPASLSAGTSLNSGSYTGTFQWVTPRKALDAVCAALGYEYRVNADGTLDANTVATLFGSTPTGFVTRRSEGREDYLGVLASQLEQARDLDDYTTKVRAIAKTGLGTASASATPYKDINGNAVVLTRVIETPESEDANAAATALINKFSATRKGVRLSSATFAIPSTIEVGASLYVFDPRSGLVDTANQVHFEGETLYPAKLRVYGYTWPIREGMGVAFRNGDGTWTDLTPWIEWETGDTTIDVGGYQRTLFGDPSYSSSAGIMPAVEQGRWVELAPTVDQGASANIANTPEYCRYKRDGTSIEYTGRLAMTAAGTAGSAVVIDLPIASIFGAGLVIGIGAYLDAGVANYPCRIETVSTTQIQLTRTDTANAAAIGVDPNIAVASGDFAWFRVTYEAAVT